jgi:hypothetical protein
VRSLRLALLTEPGYSNQPSGMTLFCRALAAGKQVSRWGAGGRCAHGQGRVGEKALGEKALGEKTRGITCR